MSSPFYLTTTLPYVNSDPHVGFALEIVHADIAARYHKLCGDDVFFNTGTDEHGIKIYRKALEEGKDPQKYVDEYAEKFRALKEKLNLYPDLHFIRTTDSHHKRAAQEFWGRCLKNGDIYKKNYTTKYCVGCELEKTDSELVGGACPIHPGLKIELIEEENYFFRFSKYRERLLEMYSKRPDFVVPDYRFNEIRRFVNDGLQDFSISRLAKKMPWGVSVPDDEDHVMFVWFDALINYISTLGWPEDEANFTKFWGTVEHPNSIQMAGKDQIRQQAAMWQAMLMSAGLPPSKQMLIHGFINVGGQKMSKSLGNVIDPIAIVVEYGADALRYYLARHIHPFEDSDFTMDKFKEAYNAHLANGLGNLVSRVARMQVMFISDRLKSVDESRYPLVLDKYPQIKAFIDAFEINQATDEIWKLVSGLDQRIQNKEPFRFAGQDNLKGKIAKQEISELVLRVYDIATLLKPLMPSTSKEIQKLLTDPDKIAALFPRKE